MNLDRLRQLLTERPFRFFLLSILVILIFLFLVQSLGGADLRPQNVKVTNVTDTALTISWTTDKPTQGKLYFSANPQNLALLLRSFRAARVEDEVDDLSTVHSVDLKGLSPETTYSYRISNGSTTFNQDAEGKDFPTAKTGSVITSVSQPHPIFGQVKLASGKVPSEQTLVYLTVKNQTGEVSAELSALTRPNGFWVLDLGNLRSRDLTQAYDYTTSDTEVFSVEGGQLGFANASLRVGLDQPTVPLVINPVGSPLSDEGVVKSALAHYSDAPECYDYFNVSQCSAECSTDSPGFHCHGKKCCPSSPTVTPSPTLIPSPTRTPTPTKTATPTPYRSQCENEGGQCRDGTCAENQMPDGIKGCNYYDQSGGRHICCKTITPTPTLTPTPIRPSPTPTTSLCLYLSFDACTASGECSGSYCTGSGDCWYCAVIPTPISTPTPTFTPTPTLAQSGQLGGPCTKNEDCIGFDANVRVCDPAGKILCTRGICKRDLCDVPECNAVYSSATEAHQCQLGLSYNRPADSLLCCPDNESNCDTYCMIPSNKVRVSGRVERVEEESGKTFTVDNAAIVALGEIIAYSGVGGTYSALVDTDITIETLRQFGVSASKIIGGSEWADSETCSFGDDRTCTVDFLLGRGAGAVPSPTPTPAWVLVMVRGKVEKAELGGKSPVEGAEVGFLEGLMTTTDAQGNYSLSDEYPFGTPYVEVYAGKDFDDARWSSVQDCNIVPGVTTAFCTLDFVLFPPDQPTPIPTSTPTAETNTRIGIHFNYIPDNSQVDYIELYLDDVLVGTQSAQVGHDVNSIHGYASRGIQHSYRVEFHWRDGSLDVLTNNFFAEGEQMEFYHDVRAPALFPSTADLVVNPRLALGGALEEVVLQCFDWVGVDVENEKQGINIGFPLQGFGQGVVFRDLPIDANNPYTIIAWATHLQNNEEIVIASSRVDEHLLVGDVTLDLPLDQTDYTEAELRTLCGIPVEPTPTPAPSATGVVRAYAENSGKAGINFSMPDLGLSCVTKSNWAGAAFCDLEPVPVGTYGPGSVVGTYQNLSGSNEKEFNVRECKPGEACQAVVFITLSSESVGTSAIIRGQVVSGGLVSLNTSNPLMRWVRNVLAAQEEPIVGAQVKVQAGGYSLETSTNSSGEFSLSVPAGFAYNLTISAPGYKTFEQEFSPLGNLSYDASFSLESGDPSGVGGEGQISVQGGRISLNPGWNLVSVNVIPPQGLSAQSLLQGDDDRARALQSSYWNPETSSWQSYVYGVAGQSSDIVPGQATMIKSDTSQTWEVTGSEITQPIALNLSTGLNLFGIPYPPNQYTAEKVIDGVNTVMSGVSDEVTRFESGLYESFIKKDSQAFGQDFPIESNRGYFIKVNQGVTWTP